MTDEVQVAVVTPAPEQAATAAPATEVSAPEVAENQNKETPAEKVFTQADLDAAIGKRLAREQRKWEREQAAKQAEMQTMRSVPAELPPADQFDSTEAYADALAERKAHELLAKREAAKQQAEIVEAYHDKEEEVRAKYDDFDQVAYNPKLPITDVMAETIRASEVGPELAYHLGSNPKEAERIAKLSPFMQAKEIGRIEANLVAQPPVKKTTSAPAPISPVTARVSGSPAVDTTDPRATKSMSTSDWIKAERERQIKKLQSQHSR